MKTLAVITLTLLQVLVISARVYSDGGMTDRIHACVDRSGVTRIVDLNDVCLQSEMSTHWSTWGFLGSQAGKNGPSTNLTSFVDLNTMTFTSGNGFVKVTYSLEVSTSLQETAIFRGVIDGVILTTPGEIAQEVGPLESEIVSWTVAFARNAGPHTFKIQWKSKGGNKISILAHELVIEGNQP